MNKLERQFARRLDELEADFLARYRQYLDRVIFLPYVYDLRQVATLQLPQSGMLANLLIEHAQEAFAAGQAHGDILCRELHKKYAPRKLVDWQPSFTLSVSYDAANFWLKPEGALKALEARAILLAGDVERDILAGVKQALIDHLNGVSRRETEQALAKLLSDNIDRAGLIATTETTYAYNRGRLLSFRANEVDYVQFSAVMDGRTSAQCRSRHGKVMRLDSPELANNTPPLHGRCRSVLSPVYSKYQPKLITDKSTDWSKVAPLPKKWRTDQHDTVSPASPKMPQVAKSPAEKEIDRLLAGAPLYDRQKLASQLLKESGINCPVNIVKLDANGEFRWQGKSGDIVVPHELRLKLGDLRPERYRIKTVFHEITHARISGTRIMYSQAGFERWLSVEETVAETVAHYMTKAAGITGEIVPSYSKYLTKNLPRLKHSPDFADCKSIADFGKVFANYRYDKRVADWGSIIKSLDSQHINMVEYSKHYKDYVMGNTDDIVKTLGNLFGAPLSLDDHKHIKDLVVKAWERMDVNHPAFTDSLIVAMNRLGVN